MSIGTSDGMHYEDEFAYQLSKFNEPIIGSNEQGTTANNMSSTASGKSTDALKSNLGTTLAGSSDNLSKPDSGEFKVAGEVLPFRGGSPIEVAQPALGKRSPDVLRMLEEGINSGKLKFTPEGAASLKKALDKWEGMRGRTSGGDKPPLE